MSQAHPLSDDQVGAELRKMTAFIKQEAQEKAREIQIKADEEFNIEKSKLVRQETDAIDAQYEKKFKQAAMAQQIVRSTAANKSRLRVLASRQELLDDIFDGAEEKLSQGSKDKAKYQEILKNLILEGFYALSESEVLVRARKQDTDIAKKAIDAAITEYKKSTGEEIAAKLYESQPVPKDSAGGVWIIGGRGKIEIDNTFEARLNLLRESALPSVREALFGKNANRKYYD